MTHALRCPARLVWALVLPLAGCRSSSPTTPTSSPQGAVPQEATPSADDPAPQASTADCDRYAAKVCDTLGETNPVCEDIRAVAPLLPPKSCIAAMNDVDYTLARVSTQRELCRNLTARLCADIGEETDTCELARQSIEGYPVDRCQTMVEHYDEVLADLREIHQRSLPLAEPLAKKIAGEDAPSFGPANAPVTIVEFSDFQCPYCARASEVVEQIRRNYPNDVRFVFRQYPLPFHKNAHKAAEAALAAEQQGKFWPYHDLLFEHQSALSDEDLRSYAKEAGLNLKRYDRAMRGEDLAKRVDEDIALGEEASVSGTPTMFVNGKRLQNAVDVEVVFEAIDTALAEVTTRTPRPPSEGGATPQ